MRLTISDQMAGSSLKGPHPTEGVSSTNEYPTGIMVTMNDIKRMEMNNALDREVR